MKLQIANRNLLALLAVVFVSGHGILGWSQTANERDAIVRKGIEYLRHHGQQDNGAFSPKVGIGS